MISILPRGWRYLDDGERAREGDLAYGELVTGEVGWGKVPPHAFGKCWFAGTHRKGFPYWVARRITEASE